MPGDSPSRRLRRPRAPIHDRAYLLRAEKRNDVLALAAARRARTTRQASVPAGGREASARGDDVFAAFERAPAALEAARAMDAGGWPDGIDVRLRIGMHRGRPALTDTGYVGLSVHAVARTASRRTGGRSSCPLRCARRSSSHSRSGSASGTLAPGDSAACPEPIDLFPGTRLTCPPTSRHRDRPPPPTSRLGRRATDATCAAWRPGLQAGARVLSARSGSPARRAVMRGHG